MQTTIAYHFVNETLRDGRQIPADGEWLEHDGEAVICESGLHFSLHPSDALKFAPGNTLCLVEVDNIIEQHDDKGVCTRRKIIKRIDAEPLLREFARWSALQVIELWDAPDVVRQYLTTGDESLRAAARDAAGAARDAARAAGVAAWAAGVAAGAARDAAWAAGDAAWAARVAAGAARDAAWAARAAGGAAWAAGAAGAAQRNRFKAMVDAAFEQVEVA